MRLAIVADTHMPRGRRELPAAAVSELQRADLIVHLGDFSERAVLDQISALGPPVEAVHGNVDSPELRRMLPASKTIDVEGASVALVHDAGPARGRISRLRRRYPEAEAVLFGHSHLPMHEVEGEFQIFNPGSPTERRRAPARTMGIAEAARGRLRFRHLVLG